MGLNNILKTVPFNVRNYLLSLLIENIEEGILLEDAEGKISFVTPRAAEILGYSTEELFRKDWRLIVPGEELDKIDIESKKRRKGISSAFKASLLSKDSRRIPVIISAIPISCGTAQFHSILSIVKDVTEQKQAEEELKISEERHRKLVELSPDAITLTDLDSKIIMVNKQTILLFGYDNKDDLIGKSTYELISPSDQLHALENTKKMFMQGSIRDIEYTMMRKDGSLFPAELNATCFTDDLREPAAFMFVIRDITERKKAQEEQRKLEEKRSDFIDKTAHELRTPLTIIKGYTEHLLKQEKDEKKLHMFNNILDNVRRLEDLCNSVSDIYCIEEGNFDVELETMEMHNFLSTLLKPYMKLYEGQIEWTGIKERVIIKGDAKKLENALSNVLDNAVRYTSNETRKITLEMDTSEFEFGLIVTDNGAGIEHENLEKIFKKFESIPTKYDVTGTGIGLYIAREIINAHNGTINAYSEGKDKGVTITIKLPRVYE